MSRTIFVSYNIHYVVDYVEHHLWRLFIDSLLCYNCYIQEKQAGLQYKTRLVYSKIPDTSDARNNDQIVRLFFPWLWMLDTFAKANL